MAMCAPVMMEQGEIHPTPIGLANVDGGVFEGISPDSNAGAG